MATSTVSALLRANQAYFAQLSDSRSLDWGVAFTSNRFGQLAEANQFREVIIEKAHLISAAFESVEVYYAERKLTCYVWAPAADEPIEDLEPFLSAKGFSRRDVTAMAVREWVDLPVGEGIRVLPARAMRKALRTIVQCRFADAEESLRRTFVDAVAERLNDPRTDGFVGMLGDTPAGYCSLFQIGDIGRISDLFVADSCRGRGVATALLGQVLRLARRLLLRITCLPVAGSNDPALQLFRRCGMVPDGVTTEFVASGAYNCDS